MLFVLVIRMLVVPVVLMVLEVLVVFVGGIFENGISPFFFVRNLKNQKSKFLEPTKNIKIPKSYIEVFPF